LGENRSNHDFDKNGIILAI